MRLHSLVFILIYGFSFKEREAWLHSGYFYMVYSSNFLMRTIVNEGNMGLFHILWNLLEKKPYNW